MPAEVASPRGVAATAWVGAPLIRDMRRVPLIVRAVIAGLVVTSAAVLPWGFLVQANLKAATDVPWAAAGMTAYVFLYLKYLGGWGWPRSTATVRRDYLRAARLSARAWSSSLLSGTSAFAASIALLLVVRRLVAWPAPSGAMPVHLSAFVIASTMLVSAAVAGVSEEAGFRGYMQRMMERRYGPSAAICISSVVFGAAHLSHGFRPVPLLFDTGWGALYGILAYVSGSIVPGIILHSSLDFVEFWAVWKHALPARPLVWQSGPDAQFVGACAATVVLALVAVWGFRRLAGITRECSTCGDPESVRTL
jgi:membrane protease YdiL (CAAX protease family)